MLGKHTFYNTCIVLQIVGAFLIGYAKDYSHDIHVKNYNTARLNTTCERPDVGVIPCEKWCVDMFYEHNEVRSGCFDDRKTYDSWYRSHQRISYGEDRTAMALFLIVVLGIELAKCSSFEKYWEDVDGPIFAFLSTFAMLMCVGMAGDRYHDDVNRGWAHDSFVSTAGNYSVVPHVHQNNDTASVDYLVPDLNRTLRHVYSCDKHAINCSEVISVWNETDSMMLAMYGTYAQRITPDTPVPTNGNSRGPYMYATMSLLIFISLLFAGTSLKCRVRWFVVSLMNAAVPVAMLIVYSQRSFTAADVSIFALVYANVVPLILYALNSCAPVFLNAHEPLVEEREGVVECA